MNSTSEVQQGSCPHFDHHEPGLSGEEVYGLYGQLREHPVAWSRHSGGFWILSRHDDVQAALKDWQTFSSVDSVFLPPLDDPALALENDPPEHSEYRKLFLPVAGRTAVTAKEGELGALIKRIVDDFASRGGGDAVKAISEVMPAEAVALMAGLSEEVGGQIVALTAAFWEDFSKVFEIDKILLDEVDARRGGTGDDYLSWLGEAEVFDRPINRDELANILRNVVIAGHETTMNASANMMYELAIDPALQKRLRDDPGLIPNFVEETLRHRAPVHLFFRTLTRDVTLHDVEMRKGDKVALVYASANRDEEHYPDAEALMVERANANRHLSFGTGIHRCIGAPLAQTELRLLVAELLSHGTFELARPAGSPSLKGGAHVGFPTLELQFVEE